MAAGAIGRGKYRRDNLLTNQEEGESTSDDTIMQHEETGAICDLLARLISNRWLCESRVDVLTLRYCSDAPPGVLIIQFGGVEPRQCWIKSNIYCQVEEAVKALLVTKTSFAVS
jgi:hypothetical protein